MNKKTKIILIVIGSVLLFFVVTSIFSCLLWEGLINESEQRLKPSGKEYTMCENLDEDHLYIVTQDDYNGEINYYKLDWNGNLSDSNEFKYEENKIFSITGCFESYIDKDTNEVLNRLNKKNCKVYDKNDKEIRSNKKIDNIIQLVSKLKHDIILADIIELDGDYFVIIGLNVNFWSPYTLYIYGDDNKLHKIYTFDGEKIISLKIYTK